MGRSICDPQGELQVGDKPSSKSVTDLVVMHLAFANGKETASGSMKDVPLVSGMRQTREVVGENKLSELGKHCTSCRAVT